ncbi:MAG: hypothetical protein WA208_11535 [Thermoanaerobaculia bacterium]
MVITAAVFLTLFVAFAADAHDINVNARGPVNDCSDVTFSIGDGETFKGEQRLQVGGAVLALRLGSTRGIPLKISGSDRSGYELLLCKGAGSAADLGTVRLEQRGSEISVEGPDSNKWAGYLLVKAPRNGELDVQASNGPVSIDTLSGRLDLRTANGPVSLKNMGGAVTVEARNGPLSFSGRSGEVKLTALNGPMTIQLEGTSWEGGELEASTQNGPLSLRVPDQYATGIVVKKGAHAPFNCPAELCGERARWPEDRTETVEIGSLPARIRVTSQNGPVTVGKPRAK